MHCTSSRTTSARRKPDGRMGSSAWPLVEWPFVPLETCSSTNGTGVLDFDIEAVEEASFARFFGDSSALIGAEAGRAERSDLDGPGNCG